MNEKNQYLKSGQGRSERDHHFHDMKMWIKNNLRIVMGV